MVNAFWLDRDLERAATWLVDRHVTSSVFECSMVLTTAVQRNGYPESDALYVTHPDHPLICRAARSSPTGTLRPYTDAAHEEWRYRWGSRLDGLPRLLGDRSITDDDGGSRPEWLPLEGHEDLPQVTGEWMGDDYVEVSVLLRERSAIVPSVERAVDAGLDPGIHGRRTG